MLYFWIILSAFLVNKIGTFLTIQVAKQKHLTEANDHRKIHKEKVAALGGLPIYLTLFIGTLIVIPVLSKALPILVGATILVAIGLWDDLENIGIKRRLLAQFLVANIAYFTGYNLGLTESLGDIFLDYTLTIGLIGLMINGVNFIDGINGLAGGLGVMASAIFAILFYSNGYINLSLLAMVYLGALLGFLSYNFGEKAAIFMGDNGSTIMGFLLAIFSLKVWNFSSELSNGNTLSLVILGLIALPILDLFGVVITRIINSRSPFQADRNHIHHLVTDAGNTHPKACLIILGWVLVIISIFYFEISANILVASAIITMSYMLLRVAYTNVKSPEVSPSKWGKPVAQPTPIG